MPTPLPGAAGQGAGPSRSSVPTQPRLVPVAIVWAAIVAVGGGLLTGFLIGQFGVYGAIAFYGLGVAGGFVSRKITGAAAPVAGWALAVACLIAFAVAEVSWYHWTYDHWDEALGEHRPTTWLEAARFAPKFLWAKARPSTFIGALLAAFGAESAYRQAAKRYRWVAVEEA